jgi:hypothetical protein
MIWRIDHSQLPGYLKVSVEGKASLSEYQMLWAEIVDSKDWEPGTPILKDIRGREPLGPEGFQIVHGIAEILSGEQARIGESLVAIVANEDEGFRYGRVLEYAVRIRNSEVVIRTFGSEQSAIDWLSQNNQ